MRCETRGSLALGDGSLGQKPGHVGIIGNGVTIWKLEVSRMKRERFLFEK
jgi:hypothetical protein